MFFNLTFMVITLEQVQELAKKEGVLEYIELYESKFPIDTENIKRFLVIGYRRAFSPMGGRTEKEIKIYPPNSYYNETDNVGIAFGNSLYTYLT